MKAQFFFCKSRFSFRVISLKSIILIFLFAGSLFLDFSRADAVSDWNATTVAVQLRVPNLSKGLVDLTYLHIAIYDAVNAINPTHQVFAVIPTNKVPWANLEAAVHSAARRVLMRFYAADSVYVDSVYQSRMTLLPNDSTTTKGAEIGNTTAEMYLSRRTGDGREANIPYVWQPLGPGVYQPTPPGSAQYVPVSPWQAYLLPFSFDSSSQYRAPDPPLLTSAAYTTDFDEVKVYGSLDSSSTTPEQREIARFHTENPGVHVPRNIRDFAASQSFTLSQSALFFAQIFVSIGDALISGWNSKYFYNSWRPSTAIRNADIDGNPSTEKDTLWQPLVTTPRHPEYPAAHGVVSGSIAYTIERFFGTQNKPITLTSTVTGTQHIFTNINDYTAEIADARVWGGMHFRSSCQAGLLIGQTVAYHVADQFTPLTVAQSPWVLQNANGLISTSNPEVQLSAVDENVCWGINTINWQYLRTTDGGTNWTVSTITGGATGSIGYSITALDGNTAWATTSSGIFKTTDGGLTWAKQTTAFPSGGYPNVIHFFDSNNGVCVGDPNGGYWAIYTTTNGGTNWTRVPSVNIPSPLSGELGIPGNRVITIGNNFWFSTFMASLYRTTDRGMTWTVARNVVGNSGFGFAFKDSFNGLACTFVNGNKISRTSDGGVTWAPIVPFPPGLSSLSAFYVAYAKGSNGSYVITSNNNVGGQVATTPGSAYSNDNGTTWTYLNDLPLGQAVFASWNVGWSSGLNTSIYKWDSPLLPVELTSFTAHAQDQTVILNWVTATEINNRGFEIQRKVAKGDFTTVGFVKGEGTATIQKEYTYTDQNLSEGKYLYRLKQLDFSGESEYSKTIEVEVRPINNFTLEQNYPNPFNPTTTIGYVLKEKSNAKLSLINILGEEVAILVNEEQDKGFHKVDLNAANLPSGVYLYKLQAGNFIETKKLMLLK